MGHAGTLDPFATGLLLVLVGKATRTQRFLMALPKTYRAVARLGWTSTTGDPEGELSPTGRIPDDPQITTGDLMQRPHAFSAVKVGGRRAYELAREGATPELAERPVTVHRAERLALDGERAEFEIECSAGTYVRQLVAALGDAYCERLERTAIGSFRLEDADPERVVALSEALAFLPERPLSEAEARHVAHGRRIEGEGEGSLRLTHEGELIAIGEAGGGEIQPDVVLVP
ncbi:MAG: tRNA pseudouridine55 synthase [Thermoleophilaceae bacterium]|nr:tRNA pseudouridine55 synthase [Thermoleophilaceae bacterium]